MVCTERYAVRVADLRGERRRQSALNENYDLTVRTVHPGAADVVIGVSHRDWFRAFPRLGRRPASCRTAQNEVIRVAAGHAQPLI